MDKAAASTSGDGLRRMGPMSEAPDPMVVEHIYRPWLKSEQATLPYLTEANLAHVIMLGRTGIIPQADAEALLRLLLRIDQGDLDLSDLDDSLEGLYYNYERYLVQELGSRTGGRVHTGRSRNDLGATVSRMRVRHLVLDLLEWVILLRSSLLDTARRHLNTVITGYTHLQPAQPITLGFYLAGIEQALQRDTRRFFRAFDTTNRCCLGAGALAGTGFPIDRQLVADLLGFDGFIENSLDAVATRDYLLELLSDLAILGTALSRFAQDLFVWYSYDFRLVILPDRLAGSSSIMPQKKNPVVLESTKGRLAHIYGALVSALSAMKNTHYTNAIDVNRESFHCLDDAVYQARATLELLRATVEGIDVDRERAYELASANFSTVTQLADLLVSEKDYSFREAHELVALVVRSALEQKMIATQITSQFIDQVALADGGSALDLPEDLVRQALDPVHNVRARSHPGGPAPDAVGQAIDRAGALLQSDRQHLQKMHDRLEQAARKLRSTAREMIGSQAATD